ncbi:MAG: hypothetical protein ABI652_01940 [Acidobacteriota bacterium]
MSHFHLRIAAAAMLIQIVPRRWRSRPRHDGRGDAGHRVPLMTRGPADI